MKVVAGLPEAVEARNQELPTDRETPCK
jgi:hypothetical protein